MADHHQEARDAAQKTEGIQEPEEIPGVDGTERFIQMEGNALKEVAERNAADHGRNDRARKKRPVPGRTPFLRRHLAAVVKGKRPQDERNENDEHRPVKPGERRGVDHGPGGKHRAAPRDEPHLITVPMRSDGINHAAAFGVGFPDKGQKRSHAHVLTVHDGKAHEKHADE